MTKPAVEESVKPEASVQRRRAYAIAFVGIAMIFLVIGIGIGMAEPYVNQGVSGLNASTKFSYVYGTASTGSQTGGYPIAIYFYTDAIGTLSSGISASGLLYDLLLPIGLTYTVTIEWQNTTSVNFYNSGIKGCNTQPHTVTPSGAYVLQNFSCP